MDSSFFYATAAFPQDKTRCENSNDEGAVKMAIQSDSRSPSKAAAAQIGTRTGQREDIIFDLGYLSCLRVADDKRQSGPPSLPSGGAIRKACRRLGTPYRACSSRPPSPTCFHMRICLHQKQLA